MSFQATAGKGTNTTRTDPIRALVLDDDAFDRTRIRRFTEKSDLDIVIEEAPSLTAMAEILDRESFDVIMIDYNLAEGDGLDALQMIQGDTRNKDAAVIMISGQEQTAVAVSAFRQGCQDFLNKHELSVESLRHSMLTAMSQNDARHFFNPMGSDAFREAIEAAVVQSFQSEKVQAAIADGFSAATKRIVIEDVSRTSEEVTHFVTDFLDEQDFHFNSLPVTSQ